MNQNNIRESLTLRHVSPGHRILSDNTLRYTGLKFFFSAVQNNPTPLDSSKFTEQVLRQVYFVLSLEFKLESWTLAHCHPLQLRSQNPGKKLLKLPEFNWNCPIFKTLRIINSAKCKNFRVHQLWGKPARVNYCLGSPQEINKTDLIILSHCYSSTYLSNTLPFHFSPLVKLPGAGTAANKSIPWTSTT